MANVLEIRKFRRSLLLCGTGISFAAFSMPALAQSTDTTETVATAAPVAAGDIVVTALRRNENLQSAPADITALTGNELRNAGAQDYRDFLSAVPGVTYASNGGFKDKIFIRGLSDSMSSRVLSTTGVYLDEVPLTEVDGTLGDFGTFDINRVEILKGPQGTLYGSSSMGGTVRIITNKPDVTRYEAAFDGTLSTVEHGGTNYQGNAMVNIPIVKDVIALRVAGGYRRDAGWIDNSATGQSDVNKLRKTNVRAQLAVKPTDKLTISLMFQYEQSRQNYGPFEDFGAKHSIYRIYPEYSNYNTKIYNATIDYDLGFAHLLSTTSYVDKKNNYGRDFTTSDLGDIEALSGVTLPTGTGVGLLYKFPNKLFTQEVRVASDGTGKINWIVGGYYSNFKPHNLQEEVTTSALTDGMNIYTADIHYKRKEFAGFGELSYKPMDRLELTAGVRVFKYNIDSDTHSSGYFQSGDQTTVTVSDHSTKETSHVAKFRAAYKATDDNLIFAQASQGYRAGGIVNPFSTTCQAELATLGYSEAPASYKPDKLWDYEIGSKNSFLNKRVTFNATAYYIDWQNAQVARNLSCGNQFISNAGKSRSRGAEIETTVTPIDHLDLRGTLAYTKATFAKTNSQIGTVKGADLPNAPRWTYSGSAQYTIPFSNDSNLYLRGDFQHVGSRLNDLAGKKTGLQRMPSYTLFNARLGAQISNYEVAFFVTNLTNERAVLNASYSGSNNYYTLYNPRTIGLNIKANY